jgi:hypothetical protein
MIVRFVSLVSLICAIAIASVNVMNSFDYIFYNYIRPLDFLLLAEVGIISNLVALEANKPMMHFSDPYRRAFTIAVLPKLKKIKAAAA